MRLPRLVLLVRLADFYFVVACASSYLSSNKLNGTIPSSLGNLTALQYLCVRRTDCRRS